MEMSLTQPILLWFACIFTCIIATLVLTIVMLIIFYVNLRNRIEGLQLSLNAKTSEIKVMIAEANVRREEIHKSNLEFLKLINQHSQCLREVITNLNESIEDLEAVTNEMNERYSNLYDILERSFKKTDEINEDFT